MGFKFNPFTGQLDVVDGTGSAASDSFKNIDVPTGTDPVATSPTDTLTLAAGSGISIVGSASNTITISSSSSSLDLVSYSFFGGF
jgi:hypothetical protein